MPHATHEPAGHTPNSIVPGQLTPAPPQARRPSVIGRIVVIAMFALGAFMGSIAVWYWTTQVKLADTKQSEPPPPELAP